MKDVEAKKIAVTDDEKKKVADALEKMKGLKDSEDLEAIKKASEELSTVAQVVGTKMYQQDQKGGAGAPPNFDGTTGSMGDAGQNSADNSSTDAQDKKEEGPIEGEVVDEQK